MGLQILSTVWGKKHVEMFKQTAIKSLCWPKNLETIQRLKAKWNIFIDDEFRAEIIKLLPTGIHFNMRGLETLRDYVDQVQSASIWQMKECLKTGDKLLLSPPDTIFGDGTIHNLVEMAEDKGSCVVVPHPRVLPSILNDETYKALAFPNPELVNLAFNHLHKSWSDAENGHPLQNSYVGGVEWRRLIPTLNSSLTQSNLFAVTHRLPTPYLVDFTEEDLQYFKSAISFGNFDHKWPGDILIPRGRQRYCGSSDACFIVEVTDHDKNVPPIIEGAPIKGFWKSWPHNEHNAQITAIWRGE